MQKPQRPFACAAAGSEYFASEAHYRLLAAEIRDRLQQDGGCVVLTGDPAPNCDLLVRQLTVVGPPRCRATAVKCQAQMSAAGVMESYRRLVGGTIEAMSRRVASWSTQPTPTARGQELDIMVLDSAEHLGDEVLLRLCAPPTGNPERWPPRLLLGGKPLAEKLTVQAFDATDEASARFDLHHLAAHETGSFIRFQLAAGEGDAIDIFKPPLIELIETYADGDPVVVNGLARRLARIVPRLAARRAAKLAQVVRVARDEGERPTEAAIVVLPTPAAVNVVLRDSKAESAPSKRSEDETPAPMQADASSAVEAPLVEMPVQTSRDDAPVVSVPSFATPEPIPAAEEPSAAAVLAEISLPPSDQSAEPPSALDAADVPAVAAAQSDADLAAGSAPGEAEAAVQAPGVAPEIAPDAAEAPNVSLIEAPVAISDEDAVPTADHDRAVPVAWLARSRQRQVALGFAAAAAILIAAVMVGARYPRGGETYLDAAVKLAHSMRLFGASDRGTPGVIGASAPVPKDPDVQRLRTTTDTADRNLLIAEVPTVPPDAKDAKVEAPAPLANSSGSAVSLFPPPPPAAPAANPPAAGAPKPAANPAEVALASPVASPPLSIPAPAKPEMHEPPAQANATASANRPLSDADLGALLHRGDQLLASGDIIAARHYFELVSEAGDPRAALRLGKTYDPAFLQQSGVRGIAGDPALAKSWYLKAIASGDKEADLQLLRLMTLYPE